MPHTESQVRQARDFLSYIRFTSPRAGSARTSPPPGPPRSRPPASRPAAGQAWHGLAEEHLADLRRIDTQLRDTRQKITAAVRASGTTVTDVFGVGPVVAATVIGDVADITRFPTAGKFASYNGTAPIEASSGPRKIYRLSKRGNRRLNHAIHMAAVTQIAYQHSTGHAYYQRKLAEGKTPAEARRALKRKILARRDTAGSA